MANFRRPYEPRLGGRGELSEAIRKIWIATAALKAGYRGQKTRVSLAKALLNEPDVLLLDEPPPGPQLYCFTRGQFPSEIGLKA